MYLDILIVVITLLGIYQGYKKGVIKSILSIITSVLAVILTLLFIKPFTIFVGDNLGLNKFVLDKVSPYFSEIDKQLDFMNNISLEVEELITTSNVFQSVPSFLQDNITNQLITGEVMSVSMIVADRIVYILSFFVLMALLKGILSFLSAFIIGTFKLPILKQVNKGIGVIFYGLSYFIIGVLISSILKITILSQNVKLSGESYILNYIFGLL